MDEYVRPLQNCCVFCLAVSLMESIGLPEHWITYIQQLTSIRDLARYIDSEVSP